MKVWILVRQWHYNQGDDILRVYDSEAKAVDGKELADKISDTSFAIVEMDVT